MKRILLVFLLVFCIGLSAFSQHTPMVKYEIAPWSYEHVFMDLVQEFNVSMIDVSGGQYVGQTNGRNALYGYGQFISDTGNEIIGKFRNGVLLHGIIISKENATVGSKDFYCSYSLSTGELQYVYRKGVMEQPQGQNNKDYSFMSQTFPNGDRYVGEFYQGKRHGVGIYYYATGGLWFGIYDNDVRNGFGAWFKQGNDMVIGLWEGEDERRSVYIPIK